MESIHSLVSSSIFKYLSSIRASQVYTSSCDFSFKLQMLTPNCFLHTSTSVSIGHLNLHRLKVVLMHRLPSLAWAFNLFSCGWNFKLRKHLKLLSFSYPLHSNPSAIPTDSTFEHCPWEWNTENQWEHEARMARCGE